MSRTLIVAVAAYGVLNGILYSSLLPLWEGFDEPFHYGCVQALSVERRLPRLGQATLSDEVWSSVQLAPASHIVHHNIPSTITFREYFALTASERAARRRQLEAIPPALRFVHRDTPLNYEANQAPLAYLFLAIPDRIWSQIPLPARIWRLRILCATASCLLMTWAMVLLSRQLGLTARSAAAALFLTLSTQTFYATTAHIANDWLAAPLAAMLLGAAVTFYGDPRPRSLWALGLALCAGLLAKAYFLAFVPFAFLLVLWRSAKRDVSPHAAAGFTAVVLAVAGPWYARSLALYGSLSALQETLAGVGVRQTFDALRGARWTVLAPALARVALWSGNNSFSTFSVFTLDLLLVLLLAAVALYLLRLARKPVPAAELIVIAGLAFYALGLLYATGLVLTSSRQASIAANPWHAQPLLAPALVLLVGGLARSGLPGRAVHMALLALWTYVISATYFFKLIPLYGGYGDARVRFLDVLRWYWQDWHGTAEILSSTSLLPAIPVCGLAAAACLTAVALCIAISRADNR